MIPIDYSKISESLTYYKDFGFQYIDVPWYVSHEALNITAPECCELYPLNQGFLVASGEQSFFELIMNDKIEQDKRYMCVTPCFRGEKFISNKTREYFIKTELIIWNKLDIKNKQSLLNRIIASCKKFFEKYINCKVMRTDIGYDIVSSKNEIELGSYGIRKNEKIGEWIYATGCAEPRLSYVVYMDG